MKVTTIRLLSDLTSILVVGVIVFGAILAIAAHGRPSGVPTRPVIIDTSTMYSDNVEASLEACEEAALVVAVDGPSYVFSVDSCVLRLKVSI